MTKDMKRLVKSLESGIATAKGVDGDFVYITVGDAKRILQMIEEKEPKKVYDMKINGHRVSGFCPGCGCRLDGDIRIGNLNNVMNFCSLCGQSLKW